jgi:hypothetical protein
LSLSLVASGGPVVVPLHASDVMLVPSLLWNASLGTDEDDDDEELAPQSPLASAKGVVCGSVHGTAFVRHVKEALVEPYGGLSAATDALGDEEA